MFQMEMIVRATRKGCHIEEVNHCVVTFFIGVVLDICFDECARLGFI